MKYRVYARLDVVTDWTLDEERVDRTGGDNLSRLSAEIRTRLVDCTDKGDSLPFEYDFEMNVIPTDARVRVRLMDEYAEQFYGDAFVFPSDGEFEWRVEGTRKDD